MGIINVTRDSCSGDGLAGDVSAAVAQARAFVEAGARVVNDVWALAADPRMATVVAHAGVPVVLMHNQEGIHYRDLVPDVIAALAARVRFAEEAGIPRP